MKITRRNALIGLGSVVVGSGALVGSGAFSSVEADRTVTVNVASDADANLGLSPFAPGNSSGTGYSGASFTNSEGTLELDLTESGSGLNVNAVTTFDPIFRVVNNGSSAVDVDIGVPSSSNGSTAGSTSILTSYAGPVISNTVSDGTNSATIEYLFTDSGGNGTGNTTSVGSTIVDNSTINISSDDDQEVGLLVGVSTDSDTFDPSAVSNSKYLSEITVEANSP